MAWSDSCKMSLESTVRAKKGQLIKNKKRTIRQIIKEISSESGIPFPTLERWYYEAKKARDDAYEKEKKEVVLRGIDEALAMDAEEEKKTIKIDGNPQNTDDQRDEGGPPGGPAHEKRGQEGPGAVSATLPLCKFCGKEPVYVDPRLGKPYSPSSKAYGLCTKCRGVQERRLKKQKGLTIDTGQVVACPYCGELHLAPK